jgi:hypothetical protein
MNFCNGHVMIDTFNDQAVFLVNLFNPTPQQTIRHTMYVKPNTEAPSCNHCCSGKAVNIIYSECVFVALVIQHVMRMRHIVICGLPGSTVLSHIL